MIWKLLVEQAGNILGFVKSFCLDVFRFVLEPLDFQNVSSISGKSLEQMYFFFQNIPIVCKPVSLEMARSLTTWNIFYINFFF